MDLVSFLRQLLILVHQSLTIMEHLLLLGHYTSLSLQDDGLFGLSEVDGKLLSLGKRVSTLRCWVHFG